LYQGKKKESMLYEKIDGKKVQCLLCAHACKINQGNYGICGVRQNIDGTLFTYNYYAKLVSSNIDPIEKKPIYHFLPGTKSYSIALPGCNFKCNFCQNWQISQEYQKVVPNSYYKDYSPEKVVKLAQKGGCESIAYTYTEPTIFFEYAYDAAILAKEKGLGNVFVTNGYMSDEAIEKIEPYLDAANVDLKAFSDDFFFFFFKARLQPVKDSIKKMYELGIWIEITTLLIPDENDNPKELSNLSKFIASIDEGIPWHISRFHPDYKVKDKSATQIDILEKAREIGSKNGLKYIYLGNVGGISNTRCENCGEEVVRRYYPFKVEILLKNKNHCPSCGATITGKWQN
jgi:pyruvate formate lyase activating enzyme